MNEKVLKTLEYTKVIKLLTEKADSFLGKKRCSELLPMTDIDDITKAQNETRDALQRLFKYGSTSFGNNNDLSYTIKSLEVDSTLSAGELLNLASFLDNVNRVKTYGRKTTEDAQSDTLSEYFELLSPLTMVASEINRCILSPDDIADDASPTLKSIRRNITITNEKIRNQLNSMLNGSARTYLQDAVITTREGRYCLPVKAEYKGQVSGMVHDQSSTGSTFFIEPAAVVEYNNKLRELEIEEMREIEIILAGLSSMASSHIKEIESDQNLMTILDFSFAKGRLAMEMEASMPLFNNDRIIDIRKGRHPLLDKKKVVPINVNLGRDFDLLVITGPNTGGKTVTLKTVGLLTLMGQAGLHIPASDRSELSIFAEVYADIGDEQSIEQSLSTFSSHMTSIVHILAHADENSLCLFDELGAGTDPTEGAALAIAILSHLHDRGIRSMATTHYAELKVFALSTSFVENACCEFDVESLRPTYRLLIGIPGKSNAFAISKKLGLSDELIEVAKAQIGKKDESFEDVISDLESKRVQIEEEKKEITRLRSDISALKKELEDKEQKLENSKNRILKEANAQARDILQEAKEYADSTIRDLNKAGLVAPDMKTLEAKRSGLRERLNEKNENLSIKKSENRSAYSGLKASDLKKGESVRIVSMDLNGTVVSLPDAKGNLFVQCGIMKTQTNIKDLVLVGEDADKSNKKGLVKTGSLRMSKSLSVSAELNLIGKRADEALAELDKYIDDAYLAHLPSVRIVHGKGTGALRNAVHNQLKKYKFISEFHLGEYGEGDAGVTVVKFK